MKYKEIKRKMKNMAMTIRSLSVDMACGANSGYLGLLLDMADYLTVLPANHLVFNPEHHKSWKDLYETQKH